MPNWNRIFDVMEKRQLDAVVASSPENVSYLADIPKVPGVVSESDVHVVVFRDKGIEPVIVMPAVALDQWAQSPSAIKDVKIYGEFYYYRNERLDNARLSEAERKVLAVYFGQSRGVELVSTLINVFREKKLVKGRVGFDEKSVPSSRMQLFRRKLRRLSFRPASRVFEEIRMVKSAEEIHRIKTAVEVTEKGIQAVLNATRPGVKNRDLQFIFRTTVMKHDCTPYFGVIGAGTEGALVNHLPSDYVLREGDIMRIDCNSIYRNYVSDVCRNAVLGVPSEKARKYFNALVQGVQAMEEIMRPGVKFSQLFDRTVSTVRTAGVPDYRRQLTGHSLGLQVVESPLISPINNMVVEEDMVMAIEAPYYELGFGAFNPEDTIRVTRNGFEKLSKMENRLYEL